MLSECKISSRVAAKADCVRLLSLMTRVRLGVSSEAEGVLSQDVSELIHVQILPEMRAEFLVVQLRMLRKFG